MEAAGPEVRCDACGGPWHPATGDYNAQFDVTTCGPCHRAFWDWFRRHAARFWKVRGADGKVAKRLYFYDHAVTSVRPC